MNPHHQTWQRLAAAARRAPDASDASAPYGFATRMAALGLVAPAAPLPLALLEKLALRGLFAAGALSLAAAFFSYSSLAADQEIEVVSGDTVSEVLSQS